MNKKSFSLLICTVIVVCAIIGIVKFASPLLHQQPQGKVMLVGTYTKEGSTGLYSLRFNDETGEAIRLDSIALKNPSYLDISADDRIVYVVRQNDDSTDAVSTLRLDTIDGHMTLQHTELCNRRGACYVATNGKMAISAHYGGGAMVKYDIDSLGIARNAETAYLGIVDGGESHNQAAPHVHTSVFSPDGKYVFATDFSADRLMQFEIGADNSLTLVDSVKVRTDSGPRHIEFSKDGRYVYTIGELSGEITAFDYSTKRLQTIQTILCDTIGARGSADIHISPDGRFLYASNRLNGDGIAVFSVDTQTGQLTRIGYQLTGIHPRNFCLSPSGNYMLVACRDSNVVEVYKIDKTTGLLSNTHHDLNFSLPVCVKFVH